METPDGFVWFPRQCRNRPDYLPDVSAAAGAWVDVDPPATGEASGAAIAGLLAAGRAGNVARGATAAGAGCLDGVGVAGNGLTVCIDDGAFGVGGVACCLAGSGLGAAGCAGIGVAGCTFCAGGSALFGLIAGLAVSPAGGVTGLSSAEGAAAGGVMVAGSGD